MRGIREGIPCKQLQREFPLGPERTIGLHSQAPSTKPESEPYSTSPLGPKESQLQSSFRAPHSCKVNQPFTEVQTHFGNSDFFQNRNAGHKPLPTSIPRPEGKGWCHAGAGEFLERSDF